jgi:hypothetical protein
MREVAIVGVGPDDSWEDRDETVTEDVGLPEHERDESRRRPGESFDDDPAEVAAGTDPGPASSTPERRPGHRSSPAERR